MEIFKYLLEKYHTSHHETNQHKWPFFFSNANRPGGGREKACWRTDLGVEGCAKGGRTRLRELIVGLRKCDDPTRSRISLKRNKDSNGTNILKEYREGLVIPRWWNTECNGYKDRRHLENRWWQPKNGGKRPWNWDVRDLDGLSTWMIRPLGKS